MFHFLLFQTMAGQLPWTRQWVGTSVSHRPLGLSSVLLRKKLTDTIPLLRMGLPPPTTKPSFGPAPVPRAGAYSGR